MSEKRKPSSEIRRRLAANVKRMRTLRGHTQLQVAKLCGLPPSYIGEIEQEVVNITLANLEALAGGLGCLEMELLMPIRQPGRDPEDFLNALLTALAQ